MSTRSHARLSTCARTVMVCGHTRCEWGLLSEANAALCALLARAIGTAKDTNATSAATVSTEARHEDPRRIPKLCSASNSSLCVHGRAMGMTLVSAAREACVFIPSCDSSKK